MKTYVNKLSDEAQQALTAQAKRRKITEQELLQEVFERCAKDVLSQRSTDLSPKEASSELNVSSTTIKRYYHRGYFPHAYMLNARVMRIPVEDIRQAKKDRQLMPE